MVSPDVRRWLKTATNGQVASRLRPDVIGKLKGSGKMDVIEVLSITQKESLLRLKLKTMKRLLDDLAGTRFDLLTPARYF